jgi:hypothetical protein
VSAVWAWPLAQSDERIVYADEHVLLIHARWQDVLPQLGKVDAVITDPPYSARTELGFRSPDDGTTIGYGHLTSGDVDTAARALVTVARRWIVVFGDHITARWWEESIGAAGWYTFAPLPWVKPTASRATWQMARPVSASGSRSRVRVAMSTRKRSRSRPGFYHERLRHGFYATAIAHPGRLLAPSRWR